MKTQRWTSPKGGIVRYNTLGQDLPWLAITGGRFKAFATRQAAIDYVTEQEQS